MEEKFKKQDVIIMKLLHYFITEQDYNPVVLQGAQNEIWLENMNSSYKIIRIVSNYIHNDEQLNIDLYRTKRVVSTIKKKTLNFNMDVLSIFTDLGDNVHLEPVNHIDCISLKRESDLKKYDFLYNYFPDIDKKMTFTEKGLNLFLKITEEINDKNKKEAMRVEKIFSPKKPIITSILIGINIFIFLFGLFFDKSDFLINNFAVYGPLIRLGDYYRLITGTFIHTELFHLLFNMYALYIIGTEVENFFGKWKFLLIYLFSAISGSLLSILLNSQIVSIGASGAIFGLMGATLYFGYNYRVYFGNTIIKQIVPIIIINLLIGFSSAGIDNFAHIGGLVGGLLISMTLGIKGDSKKDSSSKLNGIILTIVYFAFLLYMNFFVA